MEQATGLFKYICIRKGVMNTPYRVVRKGEKVTSTHEIKCSWLVLEKDWVEHPKNVPTMPNMQEAEDLADVVQTVAPVAIPEDYADGMESIKAREDAQDAKAAAEKLAAEPVAPVKNPEAVAEHNAAAEEAIKAPGFAQEMLGAEPDGSEGIFTPVETVDGGEQGGDDTTEGTGNQEVL